jgi:hypothetical protein
LIFPEGRIPARTQGTFLASFGQPHISQNNNLEAGFHNYCNDVVERAAAAIANL